MQPSSPSRLVWAIALPAMLTNVATALFGLADMWAIGQLGDAAAQGAVELGAKFMMGLLIVFNFLRSSTVALTAQSAGSGDHGEQAAILARAAAVALGIGALLLLARPLAVDAGLSLLKAEGAVAANARGYIEIRYWAGTAWLLNCAFMGWLIGQRRVRTVLVVEIAANAVHVALDLMLVLVAGWGVAGVALATVASELLKLLILGAVIARTPAGRSALAAIRQRATWHRAALGQLFTLNRDLFLRTLLLTGAMMALARGGAQQGPVTLAANGILFQLFMLATLILDGFESATQVLCGEARGARDRQRFLSVLRVSLLWGGATAAAISLAYLAAGAPLAATFSTDPAVVAATLSWLGWVIVLPLLGLVSFVLDGVFIGAGWTRAMLLTMIAAVLVYAGLLFLAAPLGNHGLWLAFGLFFVVRAAGQLALLPALVRRDLGPGPAKIAV